MYDVVLKLAVALSVVELNTFAAAAQTMVLLDNGAPVVLANITGVFPFVGQAERPVNVFRYSADNGVAEASTPADHVVPFLVNILKKSSGVRLKCTMFLMP